jgi:hypothetical protein
LFQIGLNKARIADVIGGIQALAARLARVAPTIAALEARKLSTLARGLTGRPPALTAQAPCRLPITSVQVHSTGVITSIYCDSAICTAFWPVFSCRFAALAPFRATSLSAFPSLICAGAVATIGAKSECVVSIINAAAQRGLGRTVAAAYPVFFAFICCFTCRNTKLVLFEDGAKVISTRRSPCGEKDQWNENTIERSACQSEKSHAAPPHQ